jgi:hypothetical protein
MDEIAYKKGIATQIKSPEIENSASRAVKEKATKSVNPGTAKAESHHAPLSS